MPRNIIDVWGKLIGMTDANGNSILDNQDTSFALANRNSLRYRGYYYDVETGFYYLQSRYYDPANHRFINADVYASTNVMKVIACNMFSYCENICVGLSDSSGMKAVTVLHVEMYTPGYYHSSNEAGSIVGENNHPLMQENQESGCTFVVGETLRAAIGVSISISVYYALDTNGNLVLYISPGVGGGFPSASIGAFAGAVLAPDANNVSGLGFSVGGSFCEILKGGGDYIMAVDQKNHQAYHGCSISLGGGASAPVPAEIHGEVTYSIRIFGINLFDPIH